MRLENVVDQLATECDLADSTIAQYRRSVERFSEHLKLEAAKKSLYREDASIDDLTRENLNSFIAKCQESLTNTTSGNYRRALCRLWNYLCETRKDFPSYEIKRLRRPKAEERPVVAWHCDEVPILLKAASELRGQLKVGIPAAKYFQAWIWTEYDTGLRPSDMQRVEFLQYSPKERCIVLTQHKTRKPHVVFLGDETVAAIEEIREPMRERIFPLTWGGLRKWADKLYILAGHHGFQKNPGQNLGTLRKTHATTIYIEHGDAAAAESLGHVSGTRIVRKHYIDHRARRRYSIPSRPPNARESERSRGSDRIRESG
jgi:integrase